VFLLFGFTFASILPVRLSGRVGWKHQN